MFNQFKKESGRSGFSNIAIKIIPLILILPILYLFLFVGRMEALSGIGSALIVFIVLCLAVQIFNKARKKAQEIKRKENPSEGG